MKINLNMTAEERKARAMKAVNARWAKEAETGGTLKALYTGTLVIGDLSIPCAVLEDGTRVLSETGIATITGSRGGHAKALKKQAKQQGAEIPIFLATSTLNTNEINLLMSGPYLPIKYKKGLRVFVGYPAQILPELCRFWLEFKENNPTLTQINKAKKAGIILVALSKVGINALVDEATGYQEVRDRNELQKLLSKYIAEEYLPWQKRFPQVFYRELFRLFGWKFDPTSVKRPALLGKFTNDYVYGKMPEGVLQELREKNPVDDSGKRKTCHHQHLTTEVGIPHLDKHLLRLITIMQLADDYEDFKRLYARAEQKNIVDVIGK